MDDGDVARLLRLFTFMELEAIEALLAEHARDPGRRVAQRRLALEVTSRVHGRETTDGVIAASAILFGGQPLVAASAEVLEVLEGEVPTAPLTLAELGRGVPLVDVLVTAGLASSKAEAKRGVEQQGFSVNGETATSGRSLAEDDLLAGRYIVLQKGEEELCHAGGDLGRCARDRSRLTSLGPSGAVASPPVVAREARPAYQPRRQWPVRWCDHRDRRRRCWYRRNAALPD